jgi:hypothetical protein
MCKERHDSFTRLCNTRWDVTPNHARLVLLGDRIGSAGLKDRIAQYVGVPSVEFWNDDDERIEDDRIRQEVIRLANEAGRGSEASHNGEHGGV